MTNLLEEAISCDDPDRAAKIIREALGIESDDVVNCTFPKTWPEDCERRAAIIGEWLRTEARYLEHVPPGLNREDSPGAVYEGFYRH